MSKQIMQQALDALNLITKQFTKTPSSLKDSEARVNAHKAIAALEQELAKPEQDHLSDAMSVLADVNADLIAEAKLAQGEQGCAECGVKASDGYALYCVKCTDLFTRPEQEPTVPDNMQNWAKLDGVTAWHLIERHADNWADVGKMMNEFIEAKIKTARPEQEPVWCGCGDGIVANDGAKCGVCVMQLENQIERLKSQPEQEPVAWISDSPTKGNGKQLYWTMEQAWKLSSNITPLYTSPPSKQEPVAWMASDNKDIVYASELDENTESRFNIPLYTTPTKRQWVGLTDGDKDLIAHEAEENDWHDYDVINATEAKLKELNNG